MDTKLSDSVFKMALRNVDKFYHSSSRTHIYFQPNIGSLGVKGFGNFADEAYANYAENLKDVLSRISADELARSYALIVEGPRGIEARKEIQIKLPRALKKKLKEKAEENRTSMSDLIRELIDRAMPYTQDEGQLLDIRETFSRSIELANQMKLGKNIHRLESVSVRLSEQRMEEIDDVADSMDVRSSRLLTGIITKQAVELKSVRM